MAAWRLRSAKTGRLSSKVFPSRAKAREYERTHPGQYRRTEYAQRVAGVPKGQRAVVRGHKPLAKLPGGFREKDVYHNGRAIHSTSELWNFVVSSTKRGVNCFYDDFLIAGEHERPTSRNAPRAGALERGPRGGKKRDSPPIVFTADTAPSRVLGTMPGQSRSIDAEYLAQIILEEGDMIGVVARLRPDLDIPAGVYVYGWTLREGDCP